MLNIVKAPMAIDFIKNNLFIEFCADYFGTKGVYGFRLKLDLSADGKSIAFRFVKNMVVYTFSELPAYVKHGYLQPDVLAIVGVGGEFNESKNKIKNNQTISQYYDVDVSVYTDPSSVGFIYWDIIFYSKTARDNDAVTVDFSGYGYPPTVIANTPGVSATVAGAKLWSKFRITARQNAVEIPQQIETPEMLFDIDDSGKVLVPLEILKNYYYPVEIPDIFEQIIVKGYPVFKNSIKATCLYAEASGDDFKIGTVYESAEYLLFNGELEASLHDQRRFDWVTKDYPTYLSIISSAADTFVWGMDSGETVRIFEDMPQWLYISTLKCTKTAVLWLNVDYKYKPYSDVPIMPSFQLTLLAGNIYRIPISMEALEVYGIASLAHFDITFKEDGQSQPFFRRGFDVIEKPYNARVFLLQNKYGLLESFFIDNLLEEKTVDGDLVVLGENYKMDIAKVETVYTARTGSKRISEMKLLKQAFENADNYIIDGNLLLPITFLPDTLQIWDEEDDLQRIEFQFILRRGAKSLPGAYTGAGSVNGIVNQYPLPNSIGNNVYLPIYINFEKELSVMQLGGIVVLDANKQQIPISISVEDNKLVINHSGLDRDSVYTVIVPDTAFENGEEITYSFSTIGNIEIAELLPPAGSMGNLLQSQISVRFNQHIEPLNLNSIAVVGDIDITEVSVFENILLISHNGLVTNQTYKITIPVGSIEDYNQKIEWEFNTIGELEVLNFYPAFFSTDSKTDEVIKIRFNQNISLTQTPIISIVNQNNVYIDVVKMEVIGDTLFVYHSGFEYNSVYKVIVAPDSVMGYNKPIAWHFSTMETEIVPLKIINISATGDDVPVDQDIVITFNKNIVLLDSSGVMLRDVYGNEIDIVVSVLENKLTITHAVFDYFLDYFVTVPAGSIEDFNEDIAWQFRTITFVEILSITPADGAEGVVLTNKIEAVFNQKITILNLGLITVIDKKTNTALPVLPSVSENTLTISNGILQADAHYQVSMPDGTVSGYNKNVEWNFFTIEAAPTVISFEPIGIDVPQNTTDIKVIFNKKIEAGDLLKIIIYEDTNSVNFTTFLEDNILRLELTNELLYQTMYNVKIPSGTIKNYNADIMWEFKTEKKEVKLLFYVPLTTNFIPVASWNNDFSIYRQPTTATIVENSYNAQSKNNTSAIMWGCAVPEGLNFTFNMWCNPVYPWNTGINFMHGFLNIATGGYLGLIFGKHQTSAFNQIFSYNVNRWDDVFGLLPTNQWTFVSWTVHEESNGDLTFRVYWDGIKQGEFTNPRGVWGRNNLEKFCFGSSGMGNDTCQGYFKHYSVFEEMTDDQIFALFEEGGIPQYDDNVPQDIE